MMHAVLEEKIENKPIRDTIEIDIRLFSKVSNLFDGGFELFKNIFENRHLLKRIVNIVESALCIDDTQFIAVCYRCGNNFLV